MRVNVSLWLWPFLVPDSLPMRSPSLFPKLLLLPALCLCPHLFVLKSNTSITSHLHLIPQICLPATLPLPILPSPCLIGNKFRLSLAALRVILLTLWLSCLMFALILMVTCYLSSLHFPSQVLLVSISLPRILPIILHLFFGILIFPPPHYFGWSVIELPDIFPFPMPLLFEMSFLANIGGPFFVPTLAPFTNLLVLLYPIFALRLSTFASLILGSLGLPAIVLCAFFFFLAYFPSPPFYYVILNFIFLPSSSCYNRIHAE